MIDCFDIRSNKRSAKTNSKERVDSSLTELLAESKCDANAFAWRHTEHWNCIAGISTVLVSWVSLTNNHELDIILQNLTVDFRGGDIHDSLFTKKELI